MPCNSGVSLIPVVNGKTERFAARGLYNGLALLADSTTNSYWDHITGECVHGPLQGAQLDFSPYELRYTSADAILRTAPNARIALSTTLPLRGRFMKRLTPYVHRLLGNRLPARFMRTIDTEQEDPRRERMDLGLGIWTPRMARYYPLTAIRAARHGILDVFDGEKVFVYYDDAARAPDAVFVNAASVTREDGSFHFDNGTRLTEASLVDAAGAPLPARRPQQMFTRWYGFAFTFPGCEIYAEESGVTPASRPTTTATPPPPGRR